MIESATKGFVMNQTMLRVKDPKRSVEFYSNVLGMTMLDSYKFPSMKFSLYFMGYLVIPAIFYLLFIYFVHFPLSLDNLLSINLFQDDL